MDGIAATRESNGQAVTISIDGDGRLCATTPDGAVLQAQPLKASRVRLRADTLKWGGVKYEVEDRAEARRFIEALGAPPVRIRLIAGAVGILAVGLVIGGIGGVYARDRQRNSGCDDARAVVDQSVQTMSDLNESVTEQDRSFFAAAIVEQRAVVYTMQSRPSCFSLQERAAAEGLLEGMRGLLTTSTG